MLSHEHGRATAHMNFHELVVICTEGLTPAAPSGCGTSGNCWLLQKGESLSAQAMAAGSILMSKLAPNGSDSYSKIERT